MILRSHLNLWQFLIMSRFFLQVNHADLSPNFSGTLGGITNTFSNLCGFVTPAVTGLITERGVCAASEEGLLGLFPERA